MDSTFQAVLAAFLGTITATIIITICLISLRSKRVRNSQPQTPNITYSQPQTPNITSVVVNESVSFHPSLQISMSDIISATNNFSTDLAFGDSRFGFVYRAELSNGLKLAIKKLEPDAFQSFMEFRSELEILGKLRHRNVVRLLGYCVSGPDRILIFEFFENGDLDFYLHDLGSSDRNDTSFSRVPLSWEARHKILMGVANGLAYMHELDKPIIHRDVKSSNVLLDSEFEAHISDFGLARMIDSRHTHVSTQAAGTVGYMAPEYEDGFTVATTKGDVYTFAILMLEVATGKRPNLPVDVNGELMSLVKWARVMVPQTREREMLDRSNWVCTSRRGLGEANIKEYFRIAFLCADAIPKKRPSMRDVVELLTQNFT